MLLPESSPGKFETTPENSLPITDSFPGSPWFIRQRAHYKHRGNRKQFYTKASKALSTKDFNFFTIASGLDIRLFSNLFKQIMIINKSK